MKLYYAVASFLFLLTGSFSLADVKPICTKGNVPKIYRSKYSTRATNTIYKLTANRLEFENSDGFFEVKSCVVKGKRIITLTDGNPKSVINLELVGFRSDRRALIVSDLDNDVESEIWYVIY